MTWHERTRSCAQAGGGVGGRCGGAQAAHGPRRDAAQGRPHPPAAGTPLCVTDVLPNSEPDKVANALKHTMRCKCGEGPSAYKGQNRPTLPSPTLPDGVMNRCSLSSASTLAGKRRAHPGDQRAAPRAARRAQGGHQCLQHRRQARGPRPRPCPGWSQHRRRSGRVTGGRRGIRGRRGFHGASCMSHHTMGQWCRAEARPQHAAHKWSHV